MREKYKCRRIGKHTISLQDCDVKRNNNRVELETLSVRVCWSKAIRDTNTGVFASQLLMRSQEDLVVNINLFFPPLYPIRLHEIRNEFA